MPPIETYAVDFANGNQHPHVNLYDWPDLKLSAQVAGITEHFKDPQGLILKFTRTGSAALDTPKANSVYLVPPYRPQITGVKLPLATRLFMRVMFDLPQARPLGGALDPQAAAPPGGNPLSKPEPWAVSLNVRLDRAIDNPSPRQVNVTCQFVREIEGLTINGARLNTPGSLQQIDQALPLHTPLDYAAYQPGFFTSLGGNEPFGYGKVPTGGVEGVFPHPIFTLDHAFCGYGAVANGHTPGSGSLKIFYGWGGEKEDHRVYSNDKLAPSSTDTTIGALGITLITQNGTGWMSIRLLKFQLWLHDRLGARDDGGLPDQDAPVSPN